VEKKIAEVEAEIERRMRPFEAEVKRLDTIPGVDRVTAWSLIAEVGVKMEQFPSSAHLASWAGLCPGSFESAGQRLSGKTRKGSAALRRCLCQVGSVVSHMRDNYLSTQYRRLAARRGGKRATLAVAHTVLVAAYHMLKHHQDYPELGVDYFDRLNADSLRRSLVSRLERLGHKVILEPLAQPA
jgi:transposase